MMRYYSRLYSDFAGFARSVFFSQRSLIKPDLFRYLSHQRRRRSAEMRECIARPITRKYLHSAVEQPKPEEESYH
jgi:hypothetical protein